jgi:hypothetical protein
MWLFNVYHETFISFYFCVLTGFGCDTTAVINILAHRDATQRAYIQQEYRTTYSEELSKRLVSELSGKLEVLNCYSVYTRHQSFTLHNVISFCRTRNQSIQ